MEVYNPNEATAAIIDNREYGHLATFTLSWSISFIIFY